MNLEKFLKEHEQKFLDAWEKQIIVHEDKDNIELIRKNGYLMYQIITKSIINHLSEEEIKSLAYKVAKERSDANVNIGEFVYNVNLGRSIIIKYVNQSGTPIEKLQPIVDLINRQFDLFCYYAVSRYTELKDKKIKEKNFYITQTHKDRLSILGQISSSFVHEFRNPLTSVMGFVSLLKKEYPSMSYLNIISSELEQLNFRITQFLHTSKMKLVTESKEEVISIKLLIEEVIDFLYPSLADGNIQVTTHIHEGAKVKGDRNELKQVFLNLLMNAIDAVYEKSHPRIINIHAKIKNDLIIISVSNNGPSLAPDEEKIIFEPFYTTKKLGTGIGLFVCKKIVEKHNGVIQCLPQEGLTTFKIKFPCA